MVTKINKVGICGDLECRCFGKRKNVAHEFREFVSTKRRFSTWGDIFTNVLLLNLAVALDNDTQSSSLSLFEGNTIRGEIVHFKLLCEIFAFMSLISIARPCVNKLLWLQCSEKPVIEILWFELHSIELELCWAFDDKAWEYSGAWERETL